MKPKLLKALNLAVLLCVASNAPVAQAGSPTLFKIYLSGIQGPSAPTSSPGIPMGVYSSPLSYSSFVVMSDGSVWAAGWNSSGQLGNGTTANQSKFVEVMAAGAAKVATEASHTAILKADGTLWTTGDNSVGELGDGTTTTRSSFQPVMAGVQFVAAGGAATYAVKSDGSLWTVGFNSNGQFGRGNTTTLYNFTQTQTGIVQVAPGMYHTAYLKSDGTVWVAGVGSSGQLGNGGTANSTSLVQTKSGASAFTGASTISPGYNFTLATKSDGSPWGWGENTAIEIPSLGGPGHLYAGELTPTDSVYTGVIQVAAGADFSFSLRADGTLWAAGDGATGAFGTGSTSTLSYFTKVLTNVVQVAAGNNFALALKADGTVWVSGQNSYGQLGLGDTTARTTWTEVTFSSSTSTP